MLCKGHCEESVAPKGSRGTTKTHYRRLKHWTAPIDSCVESSYLLHFYFGLNVHGYKSSLCRKCIKLILRNVFDCFQNSILQDMCI